MSERYTRLFSLQGNLYTEGSPVIIVAGAILKDNKTEKVIGQLKLQNIDNAHIKAVAVKVFPYDTVGRPLGNPLVFHYLDLDAQRDDTFGGKTPIPFLDDATRSFSVEVVEVAFTDNSIWDGRNTAWKPLPAFVSLSEALDDKELAKQYRVEFGSDCKYWPEEIEDLWYCTCGGINLSEETHCHICERELSELKRIDIDTLVERRNIRLANEHKRHRAEEYAAREKARRSKILITVLSSLALLIIAGIIVTIQVVIPSMRYKEAESLFDAGNYDEAVKIFESLDSYKDSANRALDARYKSADSLALSDRFSAAKAFYYLSPYSDSYERSASLWHEIIGYEIATGWDQVAWAKTDGTVGTFYFPGMDPDVYDVSDWNNIISVDIGSNHCVGLKSSGTVVAVGENDVGQCDVDGWEDIVAVATGYNHTVGLKSDGTVVATGANVNGQCDLDDWTDIVAIAAGRYHTVGLKSDGTVIAAGVALDIPIFGTNVGQCDVQEWEDIVAVTAGADHTVGLKRNGTVVAAGVGDKCDVSSWNDIVDIAAGYGHTVGLKMDGTIVFAGTKASNQNGMAQWDSIIEIDAFDNRTIGLQPDGTFLYATNSN